MVEQTPKLRKSKIPLTKNMAVSLKRSSTQPVLPSIQHNFKLSRSVMTVIFDLCGHEEWLRLRQVCRLFDDASFSMAKWWPA